MKRGFLVDKSGRKSMDGPGDPRFDQPIFSDGGNRLGSASGVPDTAPKYQVGKTEGLTWAPVTDSLRERWGSTPWKSMPPKDQDVMEEDGDTIATGSTYPSTQHSLSSSMATQPVLPSGSIIDDPKSAMRDYYFREYQTNLVTKECYFSWPDPNGFAHCRRYTSIFVCPVTGELFCTGKYGPKEYTKERKDSLTLEPITERRTYYIERKDEATGANVVWFNDKAGSQHGAAARAFDCLSLRKYKPKGMRSVHLGDEEPYMTENDAPPLPSMPDDIRNKVEAQRRRIATHRTQAATVSAPPAVVPKMALQTWYGRKPRSHQLNKNNYVSWNDRSMPHLLKYTCVFVCPLTGETFCCGRHGSADSYEERIDSEGNTVVWYNKKLLAEHAAAARAYDCWCLRSEGQETDFLGQDQPYLSAKDAPALSKIPAEANTKVLQLQEEAKTRMPIPVVMQPALFMPTEEEAQKDRDQYRAVRGTKRTNKDSMDEEW